MANDQSYPVKIVLEAVDELTRPLQAVNARLAKISAPVKQVTGAFSHLAHASGLSHLAGEMNEVREKTGEVAKEALELGAKLVTMEALGIGATFELAKSMAEAGHQIGETSKLLGVHTGWLQELQYVGSRAGISNEELNSSLLKFNKNMGEAASYTGEALVAFRALRINLRDSTGHLRGMESILPEVADKLAGIKNASIKSAVAFKLFGREGGTKMLQVLGEGSKGLEEARQKARELGFAMGEDGVKSSEEFMHAYTDVQYTLIGLRNTVGAALLPALRNAMGTLVQFFQAHREELKKFAEGFAQNIPQMVDGIASAAKGIFTAISAIVSAFQWMSSIIGPVNTAMLVMAVTIGAPLISSVFSLIGALTTLGPALITTGIRLGAMAFGPVIAAAGNFFMAIQAGYPIMEAFNLVLAANPIGLIIVGVAALGVAAYELIKHWESVKNFFATLWSGITAGIDAVKGKIGWLTYLIPGMGQVAAGRDIYNHFAGVNTNLAPTGGASSVVDSVNAQKNSISSSDVALKVSFDNIPKGTRISTAKSGDVPLDLSMGYAMVHP